MRLATTSILVDVANGDFDAVVYAGGHGPLWHLADDEDFDWLDRIDVRRRQADNAGLPCTCRFEKDAQRRWRTAGKGLDEVLRLCQSRENQPTVALANKLVRIVWTFLAGSNPCDPRKAHCPQPAR